MTYYCRIYIINVVKNIKINTSHQMDQRRHIVIILPNRLVIVAFGLAGTVFTAITNLIAAKFFLIFSPLYMMYIPNYQDYLE